MIPRYGILVKPLLYGLEVFGRSMTYAQCGSQAPPVPLASSALPVVIRYRLGSDIELLRQVVDGRGGDISAELEAKVNLHLERMGFSA